MSVAGEEMMVRGFTRVRAGFMPLVDCAVLAVAQELGFARQEGVDLKLVREVSWANIRDKINLGHLDCAHMLAGMPIATTLGVNQVQMPIIAPFALGLNGNGITLAAGLYDAMAERSGLRGNEDPATVGAALRRIVIERQQVGADPLTFGMVFPFSCHNYELRYWMAACGIDPDQDVRLVVIPPPLMVESLRAGLIQGYCVGEPWNSLAVDAGLGRIVITKAELWRLSPEKVLGLRRAWAETHVEVLGALIRALNRAALWADNTSNRKALADLLAGPTYLDKPQDTIIRALSGQIVTASDGSSRAVRDFIVFHRHTANVPWVSHALWVYTQMVRWGQVAHTQENEAAVRSVFRPDLYRAALGLAGAGTEVKGAGTLADAGGFGPDAFFDGRAFDACRIDEYLGSF